MQVTITPFEKAWLPNFEAYCKTPLMSELKTYCICGTYEVTTLRKIREVLNALGAKEVLK